MPIKYAALISFMASSATPLLLLSMPLPLLPLVGSVSYSSRALLGVGQAIGENCWHRLSIPCHTHTRTPQFKSPKCKAGELSG